MREISKSFCTKVCACAFTLLRVFVFFFPSSSTSVYYDEWKMNGSNYNWIADAIWLSKSFRICVSMKKDSDDDDDEEEGEGGGRRNKRSIKTAISYGWLLLLFHEKSKYSWLNCSLMAIAFTISKARIINIAAWFLFVTLFHFLLCGVESMKASWLLS